MGILRFRVWLVAFPVLGVATVSVALADFSHWICDDGIYSESSCWDDGIPSDPGESGSIDFDNFEIPYIVTMDVDATFGTLNLAEPEARMVISGREVNPAFSFNVVPGAEVYMTSSSFVGGTGVYTNGGLLVAYRSNLIDLADFEQNNLLQIVATGVGGNAELTVMPSFTNHGVMEFLGGCCAGNNAILTVPGDGLLTNTGGINLLAGPGNRQINANLDNQGTINLGVTSFFNKANGQYTSSNAINFGESVLLNIDNGATFTQTDGLIDMPASSLIDVDTGGAFNFDGGELSGQVRLTNADLIIAPAAIGGAFEFRGVANTITGDIGDDQSAALFATGDAGMNAAVTATGDFANNGTMQTSSACCNGSNTSIIVPDGNLFTNTGLLDLSAQFGVQTITADVDNQGTVAVGSTLVVDKANSLFTNTGDMTVTSPGSINMNNSASFSQDGGTLNLQDDGTFLAIAAGGTFFFNGGDITGDGRVVLSNANLVIDPNATGSGNFRFLFANNTVTGNVAPAQTLVVQSTGTAGQNAALTTTGDFVNEGVVQTDSSCCASTNTEIIVPDGNVFTNLGTLNLTATFGPQRLTADFVNQGTVNITKGAFFDKAGGQYANAGNITVTAPNKLTLDNGATFSQNGGTLDLQGTAEVTVPAGNTFTFNGGDITGTGEVKLTDADLVIGPGNDGQGRFRFMRGNNTLTGDVGANQSLLIWAIGTAGQNGVLTTAGNVTNTGTITMDGGCCDGTNATLVVPDGSVLTNTGNMFLQGNNGARRVTADFDNQGFLLIDRPSFLDKANGVYTNQGTLTIQPGDSLTITGDTFANTGAGIINGNGTLNVSGVSFSNEATVAPGSSVGTLILTGTYDQASTGTLQIEIAGTVPGSGHDRLQVNGTANLGGTLELTLIDGYAWEDGQEYIILTAGSVNSTFDNVVGPGEFDVVYDTDRVTVIPNCSLGDVNGDCQVDLADLEVLTDCLNGPLVDLPDECEGADIDSDGDVDLADFASYQQSMIP